MVDSEAESKIQVTVNPNEENQRRDVDLKQFVFERILSNSPVAKVMYILGSFKGEMDSDNKAIMKLEKTEF
jgi:hypothetical protein